MLWIRTNSGQIDTVQAFGEMLISVWLGQRLVRRGI